MAAGPLYFTDRPISLRNQIRFIDLWHQLYCRGQGAATLRLWEKALDPGGPPSPFAPGQPLVGAPQAPPPGLAVRAAGMEGIAAPEPQEVQGRAWSPARAPSPGAS